MSDIFENNKWYIHEHDEFTNLDNSYDILDCNDRSKKLGKVTEESCIGHKIQKMFLDNMLMPFQLKVEDSDGKLLMTIKRTGNALLRAIEVYDGNDRKICSFKQKFASLKKKIEVLDSANDCAGQIVADDWYAKKFTFIDKSGKKAGTISHQWKGYSREMFSTSDDWLVELERASERPHMLLAGAIVVDMLYHET
ncbi:MAG: hypothetical protein HQM10_23335 [Candidatus Riflebacteria bacterium]|nr:hypothetical protein [Candidatus Riflebacteria bacterium]